MTEPSLEVQQRLREWKTTYGEVVHLDFGGREYVFRAITPKEWDRIQLATEIGDPALIDELHGDLLNACKLWPEDFDLDDLPITGFRQLYQAVQDASPFGSPQSFYDTLQRYRQRTQNLMGAVRSMLATAFPGLTQAAIDDFSAHRLFTHITLAEQILGTEFQVPGVTPQGPPPSMTPQQVRAAKAHAAMQRKEERLQQRGIRTSGPARTPSSEATTPQGLPPASEVLKNQGPLTAADFESDAAALRRALLDG
jgi:hypothetical protein